jgi:sugar phosphate isomerase/epimerase
MTIPARSSFDGVRFGVATASLGMSPMHTLEDKFKALQDAGFNYTELGFEGFLNWVKQQVPDL